MRSLWRGRRRRIRSWWWRKSLKNKCILQAPLYGASQSCTSIESTEEMYLKLHRQQWCNRSKTLKDVTKFLSPAIAGWYLLQLRDRLMLSIDIAGIDYGLYLHQYKGKHSHMELLPFKAEFSWVGSSLVFSISVDSYLDHWQSCASSCRGPLGAAGNTDEELHQGRKANTISLIDSSNVLKLINVFIGFESNSLVSLLVIYL